MTKQKIRKLVKEYAKLFNLDHWEVIVRFKKLEEDANIACEPDYERIILTFDLSDDEVMSESYWRRVVIHELWHAVMEGQVDVFNRCVDSEVHKTAYRYENERSVSMATRILASLLQIPMDRK